ncbi:MAG: sulfotransferase, partial [bacterium]
MQNTRTSLRPEPTLPGKLLNRVLAWRGAGFPDVSFGTFARVAERVARLDDWGDDAAVARFRRCAEAVQGNDNLSPWGRISLRIYLQSKFVNHLRRVAFVRQHPEVRDVPIEAPLVIFGWYRTGTTLLHSLLTADPAHRAPRTWEMWFPVPFGRASRRDTTLRRAATAFLLKTNRFVIPEQAQAHYIEVDSPEECFFLFENAGCSTTLFNTYQAYDYGLRLLEEDLEPVYAEHKLQLQILSLVQPRRRWVLKCP